MHPLTPPETATVAATPTEFVSRVEPEPIAPPPAPEVFAQPVEAVAPAAEVSAAPPAVEPIVLPSDLEQVETDPEKLRVAASKFEPPPPPRRRRVLPPLPPVSDEPLVQVETRK
jgi:ribonuclease E